VPKQCALKALKEMEVNLQEFPNSALKVGEWSVSLFVRFTYRERAPGTNWINWIGVWVGPRAGLDAVMR